MGSTDKPDYTESKPPEFNTPASPTDEIALVLVALASPDAKHRESTLNLLSVRRVSDPAVISKVEYIAAYDPIPYVREAAGAVLRGLGRDIPHVPGNAAPRDRLPLVISIVMALTAIATPFCWFVSWIGACFSNCPGGPSELITYFWSGVFVVTLIGAILYGIRYRRSGSPTK